MDRFSHVYILLAECHQKSLRREGHLLNPYTHPSQNNMRLPINVTKSDKRPDGILFPHIINKTAHKALEDATKAGKTHAQTWGGGKQRKKGRRGGREEGKKSKLCEGWRRKEFSTNMTNDSHVIKNTQVHQM